MRTAIKWVGGLTAVLAGLYLWLRGVEISPWDIVSSWLRKWFNWTQPEDSS